MSTPKSYATITRVFCAGCDDWHEIPHDELMEKGFSCPCGKLKMLPRFKVKGVRGRPKQVYQPRFTNPRGRA